ncbi:hypothetical protein HQ585_14420 [candidate division KSB1 bacterium]|nr:hypothetical protein [candidate division KSB1 bacterium]
MNKKQITIILIFTALCNTLAQDLIHGNAADLYDAKSIFVNPALIPYQGTQLLCGMKVYHLGILENDQMGFKNSYLGFSTPYFYGFGIGVGGQFFQSPIYSENMFDFSISRRFFNIFSIGTSIRTLMIGYNSDNFRLVDPEDPVFLNSTGKTTLSVGGGIAVIPFRNLSIGISIHDINSPNISLIDDAVRRLPQYYASIIYHVGHLRTIASLSLNQENQIVTVGYVEAFSEHLGFLRTGVRGSQLTVEGLLHLIGPISMNYSYDYPILDALGISQGSHLVGLVFEFDRLPRLQAVNTPPTPHRMALDYKVPEFIPEQRYELLGSVDKLSIVEKKVYRDVDVKIPRVALPRLSWFDIVRLDTTLEAERYVPYQKEIINVTPTRVPLRGTFSDTYQKGMKMISELIFAQPGLRLDILAPKTKYLRAEMVRSQIAFEENKDKTIPIAAPRFLNDRDRKYLNTPLGMVHIPEQDSLIVLSSDTLHITVVDLYQRDIPLLWKLVIQDKEGNKFKTVSGRSDIPETLEWDWFGSSNKLIGPGIFKYYIEWMDKDRNIIQSHVNEIYIQKFLSTIRLKISHDKPVLEEPPDTIDLYLR